MVNTNVPSVSELREFLHESWCTEASSSTQRAAEFLFAHVPVTVMDGTVLSVLSLPACAAVASHLQGRKPVSWVRRTIH
jgi:hypothetical protein